MLDVPMLPITPKSDRVGSQLPSKERAADTGSRGEASDFDTAYADNSKEVQAGQEQIAAEDTPAPENEPEPTGPEIKEGAAATDEDSTSLEVLEGSDIELAASTVKPNPEAKDLAVAEKTERKQGLTTSEAAFQQRLLQSSFEAGEYPRGLDKPISEPKSQTSTTGALLVSVVERAAGIPAHPDDAGPKNAQALGAKVAVPEDIARAAEAAAAPLAPKTASTPAAQVAFGNPVVANPAAGRPKAEALAERISERFTSTDAPNADVKAAQVKSGPATPLKPIAALKGSVTALIAQEAFAADLKPLMGETLETPAPWDARPQAPASLAQIIARAETPAMIGRQIAETFQRMADKPMELALNPQELGRVKLSISASELGITVSVLAERPETLDLMRRNIDQLAREFQSIGYEKINFAFSEGRSDQNSEKSSDSGSGQGDRGIALERMDLAAVPKVLNLSAPTGLDLRL